MTARPQGPAPIQAAFFIPGKPVPWARARVSRQGGFFTAPKQRTYKLQVAQHFSRKLPSPLPGPLVVVIRIQLLRPRTNRTLLPATRNTSDVDNWAKMILDAGNGVAWEDDSQVVALEISKLWVADPRDEGVSVQVAQVDEQDVIDVGAVSVIQ